MLFIINTTLTISGFHSVNYGEGVDCIFFFFFFEYRTDRKSSPTHGLFTRQFHLTVLIFPEFPKNLRKKKKPSDQASIALAIVITKIHQTVTYATRYSHLLHQNLLFQAHLPGAQKTLPQGAHLFS